MSEPQLLGGQRVVLAGAAAEPRRSRPDRTAARLLPAPALARGTPLREARHAPARGAGTSSGSSPVRSARSEPPNASRQPRCRLASSSRCWSAWPWTTTRSPVSRLENPCRDRRPTSRGPRPALARHRPADEQHTVVDDPAGLLGLGSDVEASPAMSRTPSTRARAAPWRTTDASAREPSSRPSAVTTMVLPAPVSPVTTLSPGPNSSNASSITPSDEIRSSSSIAMNRPRPSPRGGALRHRASRPWAGRTWPPAGR